MSTSFISMGGENGCWIHDGLLQIICWGIVNVIDASPVADGEWPKGEYREFLYHSSQGYFVGFTTMGIHRELNSPERIEQFNKVLEDTKAFFLNKGESIAAEELNAFQLEDNTRRIWSGVLDTSRLIRIVVFIQDVIYLRITIKASDKIDYFF